MLWLQPQAQDAAMPDTRADPSGTTAAATTNTGSVLPATDDGASSLVSETAASTEKSAEAESATPAAAINSPTDSAMLPQTGNQH